MNKWGRTKLLYIIGTIMLIVIGVTVFFLFGSKVEKSTDEKQVMSFTSSSSAHSTNSESGISIVGDYIANTGDMAQLTGKEKKWKINYRTPDGAVSAQFTTEWKTEGETLVALDKMQKSDGNADFTITVRIFKYKEKQNRLVTITMSDGNPNHEMVFANQKDFFGTKEGDEDESLNNTDGSILQHDLDVEAIMKGDFESLAGVWKNGRGGEVSITSDGKTSRNETISPNFVSNAKFPTLNIRAGNTGAMIALFKIDFRNPYGDESDEAKPRLLFGQNIGNAPADEHYYKQ